VHCYHFQIAAVGQPLVFAQPPTRAALLGAIADGALVKGRLIGLFERI
jgi:hypothetical protein